MMLEWLTDSRLPGTKTLLGIIGTLYKGLRFAVEQYHHWKKGSIENSDLAYDEDSVFELAKRFVKLHERHGITRAQIKRFWDDKHKLSYSDISSDEKLLEKLDEPLLNAVCERFGIDRVWLDGEDVPIYPYLSFYKNLSALVDFLVDLKKSYDHVEAIAAKVKSDRLAKNGADSTIAIIFRVEIGAIGNRSVYRYYPVLDTWFWSYQRTRYELKAIFLIAWQFNVYVRGVVLSENEINGLIEGKNEINGLIEGNVFPDSLFENSCRAWHPDDYIFTNEESCVAEDVEEALLVREYMSKYGWLQYLESKTGPIKNRMPRQSTGN